MKLHYFLLIAILSTGFVFLTGCQWQTSAKAESLNASNVKENAGNKNAKPTPVATVKPEQKVLWDFTKNYSGDSQEISEAETTVVAKYLFGDEADPDLQISSRFSGSFTKPNAKETLYYLSGCTDPDTNKFITGCPHVAADTEGWIAIYDGTTPVLKIKEALGRQIVKATDMNGDSINEIISMGGYGGQGKDTSWLQIGEISSGKYRKINNFDGYASTCSDADPASPSSEKAAVISYTPTMSDKTPVFTEEYFQAKCTDGPSQWKKITKKQYDDFVKPLSDN